jgi:Transglutaminase-like superfamily
MKSKRKLSDYDHPSIRNKAEELTKDKISVLDKFESLFYFARDEIKFGFPNKWDVVKASETLQERIGYCNTKATLLLALCKVAEIPARIHTGLIDIAIMQGILPPFIFRNMPNRGGHSWLEVDIGNGWKPIDSYINDKPFYKGALKRLLESSNVSAFSISQAKGESSCEFNFGEKGFVHMGAVVEDHGVWSDFSEYMSSDKYTGMNRMQLIMYPLIARISNRNIRSIRLN